LANGPILSILALETLSLASYAGIAWPGSKLSIAASLRYALIGIFSSACLLYGLSWAYNLYHLPINAYSPVAWNAVQALLLVGVLFKLGAFPLHGWVPNAYEGGPLPFVAFISVAPKVAALGWLSHLATFANTELSQLAFPLAVVGAGSVLAGNIGAFFQTRFLRLMGFSSVAHAGFMLLCLACPAPLEVAGFYSLALLGINYMAMGLWGQMQKQGAGAELSSVNGWAKHHFWLAALAVVSGLALAGLPPTVGFTAKFKLVLGLTRQHEVFGQGWAYGLAAFTALNTAISLYYYLRLPYHLIFKPVDNAPKADMTRAAQLTLVVLGTALLFFFFAGQLLESLL
jgi:NADH-quinone oxidoreductase subunit N